MKVPVVRYIMRRKGIGTAASLALLCVLSSLCATTTTAQVTVTSQRLTYRRVDGAWARGDLALFEAEFSETLRFSGGSSITGQQTLKDLNRTSVTPNSDPDKPPVYGPHLSYVGGSVALNCTRPDGTSVLFGSVASTSSYDFPSGLVMLPPSSEPLQSGMKVFGGLPIQYSTAAVGPVRENAIAAVLFLNGTVLYDRDGRGRREVPFSNKNTSLEIFKTWQCRLIVGVTDTGVNSDSIVVTAAESGVQLKDNKTGIFTATNAVCTDESLTRALKIWTILNNATWHSKQQESLGLQIAGGALSASEAMTGCKVEADDSLVLQDAIVKIGVPDSTSSSTHPERYVNLCPYAPGTMDYATSPCCNMALANSMCCTQAANATAHVQTISDYMGILSSSDADTIKRKKLALNDYAAARDAFRLSADRPAFEGSSAWSVIKSIEEDCWDRIFTQTCQIDSDCRYSSFCDAKINGVGTGVCAVNWDTIEFHLAVCYLDRSPPITRGILLSKLSVDSSRTADIVSATASALYLYASQEDCIGPTSEAFRKKKVVTYDDYGTLVSSYTAGNQTGCTLDHTCNWNSALNATECVRGGSAICGVSTGLGHYVNRRVEGRCVATELYDANVLGSNSQLACNSIGGSMLFLDGNTAVRQCVLNVTSATACSLLTSGPGVSVVSPFCAPYFADVAARSALVANELGNTWSKPYPIYSSVYAMCTNPTAQRASDYVNTSSWGPFCYSLPGTFNRANCTTLAQSLPLGMVTFDNMKNQTYWVESEGVCVSFIGGPSGPQDVISLHAYAEMNTTFCAVYSNYSNTGTPFQFHRPVRWQNGEYDTEADCAQGLCQNPALAFSGVTRAVCEASSTQCTERCSGCRSALGKTAGFLSERLRRREDGGAGLCVLDDSRCNNTQYFSYNLGGVNLTLGSTNKCTAQTDAWKCAALSGTYYQCSDLQTSGACPATGIASPSSVSDYIYQYLKCQWSESVPCPTTAGCTNNAGSCSDQESDDCTCTMTDGCICAVGTCVKLYEMDRSGRQIPCHVTSTALVETDVGCRNTSALTQASCSTNGADWRWFARGTNASMCAGHGMGCPSSGVSRGSPIFLSRDRTECSACGSTNITTLHTFTPGKLLTAARVMDLTWANRNWTTMNRWKTGVSRVRLQQLWDDVARSYTFSQALNRPDTLAPFFEMTSVVDEVPSWIDGSLVQRDISCYIPTDLPVRQVCSFPRGAVSIPPPAKSTRLTVALIEAGMYILTKDTAITNAPAATFSAQLLATGNATTDPTSLLDVTPYCVAYDPALDHVVGCLIGPGIAIFISGNTTASVALSIEINSNIPQDEVAYPLLDFAVATSTDPTRHLVPAGADDVAMSGFALTGTIDPADSCKYDFRSDTTVCVVFPIRRIVVWNTPDSKNWFSENIWYIVGAAIGIGVIAAGVAIVYFLMKPHSPRMPLPISDEN